VTIANMNNGDRASKYTPITQIEDDGSKLKNEDYFSLD
jgi:hypothetical protein